MAPLPVGFISSYFLRWMQDAGRSWHHIVVVSDQHLSQFEGLGRWWDRTPPEQNDFVHQGSAQLPRPNRPPLKPAISKRYTAQDTHSSPVMSTPPPSSCKNRSKINQPWFIIIHHNYQYINIYQYNCDNPVITKFTDQRYPILLACCIRQLRTSSNCIWPLPMPQPTTEHNGDRPKLQKGIGWSVFKKRSTGNGQEEPISDA